MKLPHVPELHILYAVWLVFTLLLISLVRCIPNTGSIQRLWMWTRRIFTWCIRNLQHRLILRRHHWIGPWGLGSTLISLLYVTANIVSLCLAWSKPTQLGRPVSLSLVTLKTAASRSGYLSLINLTFLYLSPHLAFLADKFGLSLETYRRVHRAFGTMSFGLFLFHSITSLIEGPSFNKGDLWDILKLTVGSFSVHYVHI